MSSVQMLWLLFLPVRTENGFSCFAKWPIFTPLSFLWSCRSSTVNTAASRRRKTLRFKSEDETLLSLHTSAGHRATTCRGTRPDAALGSLLDHDWCGCVSVLVLVWGSKVLPLVWPKRISKSQTLQGHSAHLLQIYIWLSESFWCCVVIL